VAEKTDKAEKNALVAEESKSSFNIQTFVKGTKDELDKVVWPSRQQLISESVAVVLMVILSSSLIYLVDQFLIWTAGKVFP
jgi:preprotein translocase subunit SecE